MNKVKNQNSILVLATLGVYLGLVLAGATPQILAQAATAKQFSIKDEVEAQDKLDKDPDDDFATFGDIYFRDLTRLLSNLSKENEPLKSFGGSFTTYSPCPSDDSSKLLRGTPSARYKDTLLRAWVAAQSNTDFVSDCRPYDGFEQTETARKFRFDTDLNGKEFTYKLSFDFATSERAQIILETLSRILNATRTNDESAKFSVLHKHTQLTSTDNQVIVITRLPRGSLDTLLALDAQ